MYVHGTVLEVESVNGGQGDQAYSYIRAHVLDGIEVLRCRVSDTFGRVGKGEVITAVVSVNAYKDRSQGARLGVTLVSRADFNALDADAA